MTPRSKLPVFAVCLAVVGALCAALAGADEAEPKTSFLPQMQERVEGVHVAVVEDSGPREVERIEHPVFRYSDEEREIFDATLWLWTDAGRPVALQKDEAAASEGVPKWTVCFASFAPEQVDVRWPRGGYGFTTTAPGCVFRPIPNGPKPAASERLVRTQLKQLAKRFGAVCSYEGRGQSVARQLAKPIHEYSSEKHGVLAGAIFGFASYGTNPDGYLLLELRKSSSGTEWVYGCARMTIFAVEVSLDDKPVWKCEGIPPAPSYFDNWTFFVEPRPEEASK